MAHARSMGDRLLELAASSPLNTPADEGEAEKLLIVPEVISPSIAAAPVSAPLAVTAAPPGLRIANAPMAATNVERKVASDAHNAWVMAHMAHMALPAAPALAAPGDAVNGGTTPAKIDATEAAQSARMKKIEAFLYEQKKASASLAAPLSATSNDWYDNDVSYDSTAGASSDQLANTKKAMPFAKNSTAALAKNAAPLGAQSELSKWVNAVKKQQPTGGPQIPIDTTYDGVRELEQQQQPQKNVPQSPGNGGGGGDSSLLKATPAIKSASLAARRYDSLTSANTNEPASIQKLANKKKAASFAAINKAAAPLSAQSELQKWLNNAKKQQQAQDGLQMPVDSSFDGVRELEQQQQQQQQKNVLQAWLQRPDNGGGGGNSSLLKATPAIKSASLAARRYDSLTRVNTNEPASIQKLANKKKATSFAAINKAAAPFGAQSELLKWLNNATKKEESTQQQPRDTLREWIDTPVDDKTGMAPLKATTSAMERYMAGDYATHDVSTAALTNGAVGEQLASFKGFQKWVSRHVGGQSKKESMMIEKSRIADAEVKLAKKKATLEEKEAKVAMKAPGALLAGGGGGGSMDATAAELEAAANHKVLNALSKERAAVLAASKAAEAEATPPLYSQGETNYDATKNMPSTEGEASANRKVLINLAKNADAAPPATPPRFLKAIKKPYDAATNKMAALERQFEALSIAGGSNLGETADELEAATSKVAKERAAEAAIEAEAEVAHRKLLRDLAKKRAAVLAAERAALETEAEAAHDRVLRDLSKKRAAMQAAERVALETETKASAAHRQVLSNLAKERAAAVAALEMEAPPPLAPATPLRNIKTYKSYDAAHNMAALERQFDSLALGAADAANSLFGAAPVAPVVPVAATRTLLLLPAEKAFAAYVATSAASGAHGLALDRVAAPAAYTDASHASVAVATALAQVRAAHPTLGKPVEAVAATAGETRVAANAKELVLFAEYAQVVQQQAMAAQTAGAASASATAQKRGEALAAELRNQLPAGVSAAALVSALGNAWQFLHLQATGGVARDAEDRLHMFWSAKPELRGDAQKLVNAFFL